MDHSDLDNKYFVDSHKYNCPFCKRGHVSYLLRQKEVFDWTPNKKCYIYIARCRSCNNESLHLTYENLPIAKSIYINNTRYYQFNFEEENPEIDEYFFYSVPTSLFAIDSRVPKILRELFTEAEGCLKSNYLTGASACVRKIIYELAQIEDAEGDNYDNRIKSLKDKKEEVDPTYFDTLLTIQQVTSDKVHENAYDGWKSEHLKLILSTISEVLYEIYVIPEVKKEKRSSILKLKNKVFGNDQEE